MLVKIPMQFYRKYVYFPYNVFKALYRNYEYVILNVMKELFICVACYID